MINYIGAFITTLLIVAIIREGPSFASLYEKHMKLPFYAHCLILLFLIFLGYTTVSINSSTSYEMSILSLPFTILDGLNFWIHEAGHVYFMFLGETLHFLGGTLTQIGLPIFLLFRALKNEYYLLSCIFSFWLGQNMPGIGKYIGDAREQVLYIPGGALHDWHFLLGKFNLMQYDKTMGTFVHSLGIAIMIASIIVYGCIIKKTKHY